MHDGHRRLRSDIYDACNLHRHRLKTPNRHKPRPVPSCHPVPQSYGPFCSTFPRRRLSIPRRLCPSCSRLSTNRRNPPDTAGVDGGIARPAGCPAPRHGSCCPSHGPSFSPPTADKSVDLLHSLNVQQTRLWIVAFCQLLGTKSRRQYFIGCTGTPVVYGYFLHQLYFAFFIF